ncbi:hypothetical protein K6119_08190 [Paracrocinitomix mangrovi]|uniref:hypothetical protein n=1 Tax=Paracrocinitomix mangrovi TaxID=2862509 RepID=UPI001C8D4672|nr:hypothetical protein [Paracrocinitomix mangrovi]UKN03492.1 hypothetical protein K6119_08190 [Paracrocinitomix mangrovi]
MIIEFGDEVKFVDNQTTQNAGVASKTGVCLGFTTPSVSNIEFIGDTTSDYAISVELDETKETIWTTQDLVEFVSHGEGQVIEIGNIKATRMADGSWKEEKIMADGSQKKEKINPEKEKTTWFKKLFGKK